MALSYLNIVSAIILFQLTLLVFFLFTSQKGKKLSNRLLALFFILLIINLSDGLLTLYGFYTRFPSLAHLEDGFVFLLGPTIYFYTLTMIYNDFKLKQNHLLHTLPFLLITILYQAYYHLQPHEQQQKIQDAIVNQTLPGFFYVSVVLIYLHVSIYLFLSIKELAVYRIKIRERFSSLAEINMNWLAFMLWSVVFILLMSLIYTFMPVVGLKDYFNLIFGISFFFIFIFINGVVWKGLKQPEIFSGIETSSVYTERKTSVLANDNEKHHIKSLLSKEMEENKPFLIPDISIDALAKSVGCSPKKLSQTINDGFGQNFFDFINTHRIREAEKIFQESRDPKLTVLEVMYASGFNSKSSFNTIFKEKTGLTPSAYKKQALQQKDA
jgi:AraC-like DNA-binding protein